MHRGSTTDRGMPPTAHRARAIGGARRRRSRPLAGLLAAVLSLPLVAADGGDEGTVTAGSAETSLSAVDLEVSDPDGLLDLVEGLDVGVLDAATSAVTGDGAAALAELVPLTVEGDEHFGISASSDGQESDDTDGGSVGGVTVELASAEASADATEALARIEATAAEIAALGETLGLDVATGRIQSAVDEAQAAATQGLTVTGLDLALGDLVPLEILEQLPLADLLALLDQLPVDAPDDVQQVVDALEAAVADLEAALEALEVAGATVESIADDFDVDVDDLGELEDAVAALLDAVADVDEAVAELLAAVTDLDGVLDDVLGLLPEVAGTPLLGVSQVDLGVNAVARETADGSSATLLCDPITVTILDEAITSPDCADGIDAVRGVAATADDAFDGVGDVLAGLPIGDAAPLDDLTLELFPELLTDVREEGDTVVAEAGVTVLDLRVPAVTIDPAAFGDDLLAVLDDLDPDDVLATVQAVLDDVEAALEGLADELVDLGLTDELAVVNELIAEVGGALDGLGLEDDLAALDELLEGLDRDLLETSVTTPSIRLSIDPVSTARLTVAAVPADPEGPAAPGDGDDGDDGDDGGDGGGAAGGPTLPVTGAGAALLGLLALAGAWGLRRHH